MGSSSSRETVREERPRPVVRHDGPAWRHYYQPVSCILVESVYYLRAHTLNIYFNDDD